jgi:glycosyltransferase involved in cell wall biosynthesis
MATSDFVLLRSPTPMSIVARAMARARGARTITKWAGLLRPFPGESPLTRLERIQVERGGGPALVYGATDRRHLIPFIPALMSSEELGRARTLGGARLWAPPWKILAVGRLSPEKGFDLALRGLAELARARSDLDWELTLVGDGVEARELRRLAERLQIESRVRFAGAVPFEGVQEHFAAAHVVVMPGTKEGWPKTVVEAWAHGAVPVAAAAGLVPEIVADAGVAFEPSAAGLASALGELLSDPERMRAAGARGPGLCEGLSLESFEARLERVLVEVCGLA